MTNPPDPLQLKALRAWVYKGDKLAEAYLYVLAPDQFDPVPQSLLTQLGALQLVMDLSLGPDLKLARADVARVRQLLQDQGYYFQAPPVIEPLMTNDRL